MTIKEAQIALYGEGRHIEKAIQRALKNPKKIQQFESLGIDTDFIKYGINDPYLYEIAKVIGRPTPDQITSGQANHPKSLDVQKPETKPVPKPLPITDVLRFPESPKKAIPAPIIKQKTNLQKRLSADWLIVFVLLVILGADAFAFGTIGSVEFGDVSSYSWAFFAILGVSTGIGSIVTYNRIEDDKTANTWKLVFGVLQFLIFELAINDCYMAGGAVMATMFVLVFIGVQRSIKG